MRVHIRIVFHCLDNVVHMPISFVIPILVLLILSGWPTGRLVYPCFSEIV